MTTHTLKAFYRRADGDAGVLITMPEQVDQLIDAMLTEPFENSVATLYVPERPRNSRGYPDHELRVGLYPEAKVGSLRFAGPADGTTAAWYSVGQHSSREEVFYYYMGHDEEYPQDSELPIEDIRAAVKEFLATSERPASVEWQDGSGS
jgi:hypothetical protein